MCLKTLRDVCGIETSYFFIKNINKNKNINSFKIVNDLK